jgi:hypothetical protein
MRKGTRIERTSAFLRAAAAAGISCRCTMILGYPGERAEDVEESVRFVRTHADVIDRVSLNRFTIMTGTAFDRMEREDAAQFDGLTQVDRDGGLGATDHHYTESRDPAYRRAAGRLLEAVHAINVRELPIAAREFEGVI